MNNIDDLMRIMQSLAIMMQESAEMGNMDSEVHADMAELMGYMIAKAQEMLKKAA